MKPRYRPHQCVVVRVATAVRCAVRGHHWRGVVGGYGAMWCPRCRRMLG